MQLDLFHLHRKSDKGSNAVGFALVAPILVGVFLAISQIANLINVQIVMMAAAKTGARQASRYDASLNDGLISANNILSQHGFAKIKNATISRANLNGIWFVELEISKDFSIPWLNYVIELNATGRSVDEKSF